MPGTQPPEEDTREGRDWVNWPPYQNTGGLASAGLSTRSVEGRAAQPASALLFCSLNTPSPRYLSEHTKHLAHLSSPLGTSISWVPVQGQGGEGAGTSKPPRPTRCGRTSTSHPSAGDCHPNNWSLRTARSGLHPRSGSICLVGLLPGFSEMLTVDCSPRVWQAGSAREMIALDHQ